jgi:hypothetical protein
LDLRLRRDNDDHLEGMTLATPGAVGDRNKLLDPQGDEKVLVAAFKPPQPLVWLTVGSGGKEHPAEFEPGEVGATVHEPGEMWVLDKGTWEIIENRWPAHHFIQFRFNGEKLKGLYNLQAAPVPPEWERAGKGARAWLLSKAPEEAQARPVEVLMADDEKRVVKGVVLAPGELDDQGRFATAEDIQDACWMYMHSQAIYENHDQNISEVAQLVENYIAPVEFTINGQTVPAGSWVVAVRIADEKLWQDVKNGRYTGFSMRAFVDERPVARPHI